MHVYDKLYPPGPVNSPAIRLQSSLRYRFHATAMLLAFVLFIASYIGIVLVTAYALVTLLTIVFSVSTIPLWIKLGAAGGSVFMLTLFVFLIKGLFKKQPVDLSRFIELDEAGEPQLFAFLHQLCQDTAAPMPKRVYLCPNVNAGVFYDSSIFSAFLPFKKNLLIGLGLVNSLNLSEFKAVLAHEFGHFSQKSMRLNNCVFFANHVLQEMVHGQNNWEKRLISLRQRGALWSVVAYPLSSIAWLVRQIMASGLYILNFMDASLSRQMELQADRVAIRVAGSNAIIQALAKTEYADRCFVQTLQDLRHAARHGLRTEDVFYHHERALDTWQHLQSVMPTQETLQSFHETWNPQPYSRWASHPTQAARESGARRHFIPSTIDERSPWLLFANPSELRARMSALIIRDVVRDDERAEEQPSSAPDAVQSFLDGEHAEIILNARYHSVYEKRFVELDELDTLIAQSDHSSYTAQELVAEYEELYGAGLEDVVVRFRACLKEIKELERILNRQPRWRKTFVFRDKKYPLAQAQEIFAQLCEQLEHQRRWFTEFDQRVFIIHYRIARELGEEAVEILLDRYQFHMNLQFYVRQIRAIKLNLQRMTAALFSDGQQLSPEKKATVLEHMSYLQQAYKAQNNGIKELYLPPLNNLEAGRSVVELLPRFGFDTPLDEDSIDIQWFEAFVSHCSEALDRLSWIRRKSLGGILLTQEELADKWQKGL